MRKGKLRVAWPTIALVLGTVVLFGCGSGGGDPTATRPALSAATAARLAKLSDRIASDLDAGDTCTAAYDADQLAAAVKHAGLPSSIRPAVAAVATRLVDQVNCPPPPPPPPEKPKPEDKHKQDQQHGGDGPGPPGHSDHGGFVPPGQAKLKGESG